MLSNELRISFNEKEIKDSELSYTLGYYYELIITNMSLPRLLEINSMPIRKDKVDCETANLKLLAQIIIELKLVPSMLVSIIKKYLREDDIILTSVGDMGIFAKKPALLGETPTKSACSEVLLSHP